MSVNLTVTLTDEEYKFVKMRAKEVGLTETQYVKRFAIGNEEDEFNVHYEFLKESAKNHIPGKPFSVMSVFGELWSDIPRGMKLSLGRTFNHLVKRGELDGVETAGKNSSNIQLYIRRKEK